MAIMPFVADWENTRHAEPAMRVMFARRIKRSQEAVDMVCSVVYWASSFVKNIKILESGGTLCRTWSRSTRGLTIASVYSQISSRKVAALRKMENKAREEATYITTANRLSQQVGAVE